MLSASLSPFVMLKGQRQAIATDKKSERLISVNCCLGRVFLARRLHLSGPQASHDFGLVSLDEWHAIGRRESLDA